MEQDITSPYQSEVIGLDRQRKLAEMLLKQGMAQNNMQGQMVSGRYVGASPWQGIANLANIYVGQKTAEQADTKQAEIADKLRKLGQEEAYNIMTTAKGREALPNQELAGPAFNGVAPSIQYPAVKANQDAALAMSVGAQTPQGRAFAPALMANALPKDITPFEKEKLRLEEENLKLQRANANRASYSPIEGSGGMFAMNNRTGEVVPLKDPLGQPILSKNAEPQKFKDTRLTLLNLQDATKDYLNDLKNTDVTTLNPLSQKAADLQTKFTNVQMQIKGLYELGAITGPDLKLLNQAITNPNSFMGRVRGGDTLQSQVETMNDIIKRSEKNLYKTYRLPVPAELQDKETPLAGSPNATSAPSQLQGTPQTAWMGNRKIVVKNNRWVYEDNGQAVQ